MDISQNQASTTQENTTENINIETILTILRSEVEKTLKSATQHKLNRSLTSDELNDCSTDGVSQLLKIYSNNTEKNSSQSEDSSEKSEHKNKSELSSLLNIVALSSNQILESVHKEFESQLKKKFDKQEVLDILKEASTQDLTDESEENDDDDDEKNDEDDEEEDDDDEEEEEENIPMTEEEFQQEIAEAFENIRRLGNSDGRRLARFVRDSFCEMNGREPELREMADVFSRIKTKLADEAKEDKELLSSSRNIIIKDDLTNADDVEQTQSVNATNKDTETENIVKKIGWLNIDVNNANKEEKEELLKFARSIVKEDLQIQAKNQLSKLIGRDPTKQELNDMLVQLATTSLLDCNFDSSDDASDYNPDAHEERQQLMNDIAETEAFDEENSRQEEPTLINKPVLTTPVKNKGNSSRVDYYFEEYNDDCSELLINKAVSSFKKMHDRMPSNEELDNMKHFLHTEKANLLPDEVDKNENEKENISFKLNFGAEDTVDAE